ncbi:hypothetical protein HWV62_43638 [Athelia sp. TMB]|nr:hypothetical protein HWV62_43638 [Athelia sp. TMB]
MYINLPSQQFYPHCFSLNLGMALLKDITDALSHYPDLYASVPFLQIDRFVRITRRLKRELQIIRPATADSATPPHRLPQYIHKFLQDALSWTDVETMQCWSALKAIVWSDEHGGNPAHARKQEQLAAVMFYPPTLECSNCGGRLTELRRYPVVFHSASHGPSPALTSSLGCTRCSIRYYHNYYVQKGLRIYYHAPSGFKVPNVIQIEEHIFIEAKLCEQFTLSMLFAWVSAQNCSNIYNHSFSAAMGPHSGPQKLSISTVEVWHSFNFNALLRDCADRNVRLVLSDVGSQDQHLQHVMEERNHRISTDGQRERMHACDRCEKLITGSGYKNLRYPTPIAPRLSQQGQAFFQLQQRLKCASISQILNSFADRTIINDDDVDNPADYSTSTDVPKSDEGNRKPKARLGRWRTHNEQLIVCCCGVIAARTTMFGAEAISGVKDFIKHTYHHNPDNLPDVIFFDNNCRLQAHLNKQKDTFFRRVILAVDVFHFKSKHKETDEFCQRHCNPALWKELYNEDGSWVFNSSAAEQANVWMVGTCV